MSEQEAAVRLRRSAAIRVCASVLIAGAVTALLILTFWHELEVKTDIVGHPIFDDFNPYNWFRGFYLVAGFFPIAALLLFLGLTRIGPRIGLPAPPPRGSLLPGPPPEEEPRDFLPDAPLEVAPTAKQRATSAARVALVGAVLGLEAGIVADSLWLGLVLGMVVFAAAAMLAAAVLERRGPGVWSLEERLAAVNAVAAPICVAGVAAVSASTELTVAANGRVHDYPWFPAWLGVPAAAALVACVVLALRRSRSAIAIERRALLLVAAPVGLFLLLAALPASVGLIDTFDSGQRIVSAKLVGDGWLPWRDIVLAHGLLEDVLNPAVGFAVFEDSYWGYLAGNSIVTTPLFFVSYYFLFAHLFGRNWAFLLLTAMLIVATPLAPLSLRFIFWPLVLLLLGAVLRRPTPLRAVCLAFLVVFQAIVSSETGPALLAIAAILALFELYHRQPGQSLRSSFPRVAWFIGAAIVFTAICAAYLAARGALDDTIYLTISLVGGLPLLSGYPPGPNPSPPSQFLFDVYALAPLTGALISFAYAVARIRLRKPFLSADWVMGAVALFVLLDYPKFLARLDSGHAIQPYMAALPLLLYIVYRVVITVEAGIRDRWPGNTLTRVTAHPVSLGLCVLVGVTSWGALRDRVDDAPARYRPLASSEPQVERLGYDAAFDPALVRDLRRVIDAYLGPDDKLFDFTNEPGLYFYMIGREPASRFFHVTSLAYTADLQLNLIDELREARPKLITFDSTNTSIIGLAAFDGMPTTVHEYLVSQWILDHYRPLLASHDQTIYVRRDLPPASSLDLEEEPITRGVPFLNQTCAWAYAPSFLSGSGMPGPGASSVPARSGVPSDQMTIVGWAGDPEAELQAREVIATVGGKVVGRAEPSLERQDLVDYGLPKGFLRSGFQFQVPLPPDGGRLRVFAVGQDGDRSEIVRLGQRPARGRAEIGGRTVRLVPNAVYGQINSTVRSRGLRFELPPGSQWTDYRWLALDAGPQGFRDGSYAIYDRENRPSPFREITFQTVDRAPNPYVVPVGSCAQWHGYRSRRLFLQVPPDQDIAGVRLIR